MNADNGLAINPDQVREIFERADVVTIGFPFTPERLLVDLRSNGEEGPMVAIVAPVRGIQERYMWLGQHRGRFGLPEAFSFVPWPHSLRAFDQMDVAAPLRRRLEAIHPENTTALDEALARLRHSEHEMFAAAIRGDEPWQTLWARVA